MKWHVNTNIIYRPNTGLRNFLLFKLIQNRTKMKLQITTQSRINILM